MDSNHQESTQLKVENLNGFVNALVELLSQFMPHI
jgi:hypothetical protein